VVLTTVRGIIFDSPERTIFYGEAVKRKAVKVQWLVVRLRREFFLSLTPAPKPFRLVRLRFSKGNP